MIIIKRKSTWNHIVLKNCSIVVRANVRVYWHKASSSFYLDRCVGAMGEGSSETARLHRKERGWGGAVG